jgi:hypothetical protein
VESPIYCCLQLFGRTRLGEELVNQANSFISVVFLNLAGQHYASRFWMSHPDKLKQGKTVDAWHLSIADDYVGAGLLQLFEGSFAVLSEGHLPIRVRSAHRSADAAEDPLVVINKENVCHNKPVRRGSFHANCRP